MDFRRGVRQVFGAILWFVRPSVPCCFAGGRCFWCSSVGMLLNALFNFCLNLDLRLYLCLFGCCFLVSFSLFLWISDGTLGTFSVRFCGLFVLPCLAVLLVAGASGALWSECWLMLPGGASGALLSECCLMFFSVNIKCAVSLSLCLYLCPFGCCFLVSFPLVLWISEGTLGTFSVRFCGLFVLLCLAVLLPAGASGALLSECRAV